jgi:hypothetical protein
VPEYLVKWQGLPYAESTWEKDTDIEFAQDAIDEYKAREAATSILGKTVDFQRKKSKGKFPAQYFLFVCFITFGILFGLFVDKFLFWMVWTPSDHLFICHSSLSCAVLALDVVDT